MAADAVDTLGLPHVVVMNDAAANNFVVYGPFLGPVEACEHAATLEDELADDDPHMAPPEFTVAPLIVPE